MKYLAIICLVFTISCASNKKNQEKDKITKKADLFLKQAISELNKKDYRLAIKHLLKANAIRPNHSKTLNHLGMAYYFKKKFTVAKNYLSKSVQVDPKNTKSRFNLATLYTNLGQFDDAEKQFNIVLKDITYSLQFKTFYNLGIIYKAQNKYNKAAKFFRKSIEENDGYCPAHFQLGNLYFKNNRFESALSSYKKAGIGVCYNSPKPIYHQALSYMELNQPESAKVKLEELLTRFKGTPYAPLAEKKLSKVDKKLEKTKLESNGLLRMPTRKILSPNF